MGWNQLKPAASKSPALLQGVSETPYAYFVHSYHAVPEDEDVVLAWCNYGYDFPAMVGRGNLFAVQFHPEKSQSDGLAMLRNFARMTEAPH